MLVTNRAIININEEKWMGKVRRTLPIEKVKGMIVSAINTKFVIQLKPLFGLFIHTLA